MKTILKYTLFLVSISALIAIDLATKSIFDGKVYDAISGIFSIYGNAHNYGAGFSLFQNARVFFVILAVIFVIAFIVAEIMTKDKKKHILYYFGMCLVLSGAIGNAIDRVYLGYVRDWCKLEFMNFPVFNFADMALTVGLILVAIWLVFFTGKKEEKNLK